MVESSEILFDKVIKLGMGIEYEILAWTGTYNLIFMGMGKVINLCFRHRKKNAQYVVRVVLCIHKATDLVLKCGNLNSVGHSYSGVGVDRMMDLETVS